MGKILFCGGGAIGLSAAMMLAADDHEVTVLEADPAAPVPPERSWADWDRAGVAQFRQPHNVFARFRQVCDAELPGLTGRLAAAGGTWVNYLDRLPPTMADRGARAGDAAAAAVTARRPVIESVIAAMTGERLAADLVIDATGRRSAAAGWPAGLGGRAPLTESRDSGFVYYSQYFTGPQQPVLLGNPLSPVGSVSLLTLSGDNGTWSVTVFGQAGDAPLRTLRDPGALARVVRECSLQAHWLDGTPITGVLPMAGILDRSSRLAADGQPLVTGFAAIGDAWASTNPSAGRGLSIGLVHAQLLRRTVHARLDDPAALARLWEADTERHVAPYVRDQMARDRVRLAEMGAARRGTIAPPPDGPMSRFAAAAQYDPDLFRAFVEMISCLARPPEIFARPGVQEKIDQLGARPPLKAPGPDRERLLQLLAG
jgi:2-polyprenyl-6-methoxyphenol hydroxylase-like FAD-dependent oxidoreductase